MGFGKWLLGGVCAVGAVIAAPVVLPAAGMAVMGTTFGATTLGATACLGMLTTSTGAVATTAAAAGATGLALGSVSEKKINEAAWNEGFKEGCAVTSEEYEEKLRRLAEEFIRQERDWKQEREQYEQLINEYWEYAQKLERKLGSNNVSVKYAMKQFDELVDLQKSS